MSQRSNPTTTIIPSQIVKRFYKNRKNGEPQEKLGVTAIVRLPPWLGAPPEFPKEPKNGMKKSFQMKLGRKYDVSNHRRLQQWEDD